MGRKRVRRVGQFNARDADGKEYSVHVFQEEIECRSRDRVEWIAGLRSMKTSTGDHVNFKAKGSYELVGLTTIPLTSDDPNAP
jgi:hypothetical protein